MTTPKKGTSLLYDLIAEAQKYPDAVRLGRGDPDFDTPAHIIAAANKAMFDHGSDPVPPAGLPALREAIAARVKRVNNIDADPATEIVVTNGGQEAIFLMILATLGPGDELIAPDPNYGSYYNGLEFVGGRKISVPIHIDEGFQVDPERMRAAITDKSRAILLISPNNPTGSVVPPHNVRRLVEIAEEHDLFILADDIYDQFIYDDFEHLSPASVPGAKDRSLTLNAVSKTYAMTGWRVGWITGPADLITQVKQLKSATTGATSIVAQYAALAALTGPQSVVDEMKAAYVHRRRIILDALDALGFAYGPSQGGQFVFADIRPTGLSATELAYRLLREQQVLVTPGRAFTGSEDWDSYMRFTYLQPAASLHEGMRRLTAFVESLRAGA